VDNNYQCLNRTLVPGTRLRTELWCQALDFGSLLPILCYTRNSMGVVSHDRKLPCQMVYDEDSNGNLSIGSLNRTLVPGTRLRFSTSVPILVDQAPNFLDISSFLIISLIVELARPRKSAISFCMYPNSTNAA
jgi:hypothetical protein